MALPPSLCLSLLFASGIPAESGWPQGAQRLRGGATEDAGIIWHLAVSLGSQLLTAGTLRCVWGVGPSSCRARFSHRGAQRGFGLSGLGLPKESRATGSIQLVVLISRWHICFWMSASCRPSGSWHHVATCPHSTLACAGRYSECPERNRAGHCMSQRGCLHGFLSAEGQQTYSPTVETRSLTAGNLVPGRCEPKLCRFQRCWT